MNALEDTHRHLHLCSLSKAKCLLINVALRMDCPAGMLAGEGASSLLAALMAGAGLAGVGPASMPPALALPQGVMGAGAGAAMAEDDSR